MIENLISLIKELLADNEMESLTVIGREAY